MKQHYLVILGMTALVASLSVQAHDPSMHKAKNQNPDCTAMKTVDSSKIDPNDPVMQAMMKKCSGTTSGKDRQQTHDDQHEATKK
ncbi:MAG: hypothetical protein JAZ17_01125 [Candidatus Thiodiazotropha endolucinida]|nr:hypothetical protein [Candidatus Thiodiazotropha endolucinida]